MLGFGAAVQIIMTSIYDFFFLCVVGRQWVAAVELPGGPWLLRGRRLATRR
ncbi:unnamed protein product [Ectocarpus sp. 6 AP-2014]